MQRQRREVIATALCVLFVISSCAPSTPKVPPPPFFDEPACRQYQGTWIGTQNRDVLVFNPDGSGQFRVGAPLFWGCEPGKLLIQLIGEEGERGEPETFSVRLKDANTLEFFPEFSYNKTFVRKQ